ncbi:rod shape-determining protein MreD [Staphylococcus massiliensis]|uniref:rod shape-determining protein MreD n=1 Tax=Staphylococcus massiliensis TaxID=555791 RepID=UPI001EDE7D7F|nr:rod shape-determining protein MreD [Staphylococcus massiliensis]MCG3399089.1 rod shape-determining protein MreD [Staphylococcus massiliensis]MCG3400913.1 rod shape-determining protein MreD [Staphylococcus massiliensis]MCG3412450.1 rod shape-determining protein MreD [Staphylococcus massiliensis]
MRVLYYVLIGILLFFIDTLLTFLSPIFIFGQKIVFAPHLFFLFLMIISVYKDVRFSLIFATFFGIFIDLYFGQLYGLYLFGYLIFVLLVHYFVKVFYRDYEMLFALILALTFLFELFIFAVYAMVGLIDVKPISFILYRLIPTFIMNFILLLIMFPIVMKVIEKVQSKIDRRHA